MLTADELREIAEAFTAQERERCATIVHQMKSEWYHSAFCQSALKEAERRIRLPQEVRTKS